MDEVRRSRRRPSSGGVLDGISPEGAEFEGLPPRRERRPRASERRRPARRGRPGLLRRNVRARRRRWLPWLLLILAGEVAAVGLWDPRFNVARIDVEGNRVLTAAQVVRRSQLRLGVNLFRAPLREAQTHLRAVPAVADVTLHRRLPNRVVIRVRERRPLACVAAGNALVTIDPGGVVFRVDASPPRDLPLVTGLETERLRPGMRLRPALATALRQCLGALRHSLPHYRPTRISIDQSANLCLNRGDGGYQVRLGPPEHLSEKIALLAALERSVPDLRRDCEYIDLSCPEAPAWKPKQVSVVPGAGMGAGGMAGASEGAGDGGGRSAQD